MTRPARRRLAAARAPGSARRPTAPRLLDALLDGVEQQRRLLEQDIDQVWDDFFIESCADWAVPYIGALLGLPADAGRLEVAYTIALRRRKGTPAALEDFAEVLTDWTVRVLEGWQITVWAQRLRPSAAAAGRLVRPPRRLALPGRNAVRARAAGASRRQVRGRRAPRRPSSGRGRCGRSSRSRPRPLPEPSAVRAPPARSPRRRSTSSPRPRRLSSDVGAAAGLSRTGDELDAPVRATYRVVEALAGQARSSTGSTGRSAPTIRSPPAPGRPPRRC